MGAFESWLGLRGVLADEHEEKQMEDKEKEKAAEETHRRRRVVEPVGRKQNKENETGKGRGNEKDKTEDEGRGKKRDDNARGRTYQPSRHALTWVLAFTENYRGGGESLTRDAAL